MKRITWWIVGSLSALALVGCPNPAGQTKQDANGNPTAVDPSGQPLPLTPLSQHDSADWTDVAVGADGTLHLVYSEAPKNGYDAVYYRASTDGGKTWSEAKNLTDDARDRTGGRPEVIVDGAGRVYALWKSLQGGDTDDLRGAAYAGALVYRVLDQGAWSQAKALDAGGQVRSWFASVDPQGQAHAVWVEAIKSPNGFQTIDPALFMQAKLDGAAPQPARELLRKSPDNAPDYDGSAWYYDRYGGLRGYVDAAGLAHWTAYKVAAHDGEEQSQVVYWDGQQEKTLFSYANYATFTGPYYNMPELLVGPDGKEHVLVQDVKGDRQGVLDFTIGGAADPVSVRRAATPDGEVRAFQAVQGPNGQLAALVTLQDDNKPGSEFELFVTQYQNGQWSPAVNVTNNAARGSYKELGSATDGARISSSYKPNYAAGAFDAQGRLNLAMVNMETVSTTLNSLGSDDGDLVNVSQGAVTGLPKVFFLKL